MLAIQKASRFLDTQLHVSRSPGSLEKSHPANLFKVKHDLSKMLKIVSCRFLWVFKYLVHSSSTDAVVAKNLSGSIVQKR